MVDPNKVQGDVGRSFSPEPEREESVDPNKFKRVMKVEKTDESQQQQKRRLKEGEDEDIQEKAPPAPASSFSEFMQDKNELDGLFDAESSGVSKRTAPQTSSQAPAPGSISTEGVEVEQPTQEAASAAAPPQQEQSPSPYESQQTTEQSPPEEAPPQQSSYPSEQPSYAQPEEQTPVSPQTTPQYSESENSQDSFQNHQTHVTPQTEKQNQDQDQDNQNQTGSETSPKKSKEEDASLLASQPKKDALKSKKKAPAKPAPRIETIATPKDPTSPEKSTEKAPKDETSPQKESEKPIPTFKKEEELPPGSVKGERVAEKPLEAPLTDTVSTPKDPKDATPEQNDAKTSSIEEKKASKKPPLPESPDKAASLPSKSSSVSFERFTPSQIRDQKMGKKTQSSGEASSDLGLAAPILSEAEMGMMGDGQKKKKDDFPFINSEQLTAALPTLEQVLPAVTPPEAAPSYSKLSPQVYELFEKMVGTITIQNQSGVVSTTVTITNPESIFHGAEIAFNKYSTAPNSFNLQLTGTPQAVSAFNSNIDELVAAFKQGQYAFEVNVLRPAIAQKKPLIRRKGSAGGGKDKGKR